MNRAPGVERSAQASTAAANIGRRLRAAQRSATTVPCIALCHAGAGLIAIQTMPFALFRRWAFHCRASNLSRRWKRASMRLAAAPTRRSCTVHCKEQSQNNRIGPAIVSYSPRLVRRGAGGLRDFPPSLVSKSMVWFPLSGLERSATCAAARASARQKTRSSILRGPVGATLVSTLFSKILVTRVNRKISDANLRTWAQRRRGEGVAPPQRRHSMATNSSRAEVPLVVGTAPAISSRSILRNDAASA
jgi:hypothetical protein